MRVELMVTISFRPMLLIFEQAGKYFKYPRAQVSRTVFFIKIRTLDGDLKKKIESDALGENIIMNVC